MPAVTAPSPPPRGTRGRSWRSAPFVALDFETTGLDYRRDEVVSFGAVPVRAGRVVVGGAIHQLVAAAVPSSTASLRIHELLPKDLHGAPGPDRASELLRAALDRAYLLAWYAEVELAFLRRTVGRSARWWARRTIDVRELAIAVEDADPRNRFGLSATAERYGIPVANPHEALDDAMVTAQLFLVLASRLEGRGVRTVRHLVRVSRRGGGPRARS